MQQLWSLPLRFSGQGVAKALWLLPGWFETLQNCCSREVSPKPRLLPLATSLLSTCQTHLLSHPSEAQPPCINRGAPETEKKDKCASSSFRCGFILLDNKMRWKESNSTCPAAERRSQWLLGPRGWVTTGTKGLVGSRRVTSPQSMLEA